MAREYSESTGSPSDSADRGEFRTHSLVLPGDASGLRLDQALARALPQYSRSRLQGWLEAGAILVDGRRLRAKDKVLGGEQVEVAARLLRQGMRAEQESAMGVRRGGHTVEPGADQALQQMLGREAGGAVVVSAGTATVSAARCSASRSARNSSIVE